jgi:hypothetical protein
MSTLSAPTGEPTRIRPYLRSHPDGEQWRQGPRKKKGQRPSFGARLAALRKTAGYAQLWATKG